MIKKKGFQLPHIFFSDLETYTNKSKYFKTYNDTKAYIVSSVKSFLFYDKNLKKWTLKKEERFKKVICNASGVIEDFINFYLNISNIKMYKLGSHQIHFFHNGGKFDFIFILKYLIKNAIVTEMDEVPKNKRKYNKLYFNVLWSDTFRKINIFLYYKEGFRDRRLLLECRDSYLIFKESVKSIANTLQKIGYEINKGDTMDSIDKAEKGLTTEELYNDKELINYVLNDSLIVALLFEEMVNYFPNSSILPNTTASWAKSAFLASKIKENEKATDFFRTKDMKLKEEQQKDLNAIFESWYVGGLSSLNERYQFKKIKNVWLEDVVSQYPHKMKNWKMPTGMPLIFEKESEWQIYFNKNKAKIKNGDIVCFLNYKYFNIKQNKNVPNFLKNFHTNTQLTKGIYLKYQSFLNELNLKESFLYYEEFEKLVTYEKKEFVIVYIFEETAYLFEDYINKFFNMKNEAKKYKEVAKEKYAKLMLNSLYGKFGEKAARAQQVFPEILETMNKDNVIEIKKERIIEDLGMINIIKVSKTPFAFFQIATYITSLARMWLLKRWNDIINLGGVVYYCDTDSNFFSLKEENLNKLNFGAKLGEWELNNKIYDNFYIMAPKTYIAYNKNKEIEKLACKGINKNIVLKEGVEHLINNEEYIILNKKVIKSGVILYEDKKKIMTDKTYNLIKEMSVLLR